MTAALPHLEQPRGAQWPGKEGQGYTCVTTAERRAAWGVRT